MGILQGYCGSSVGIVQGYCGSSMGMLQEILWKICGDTVGAR